MIGPWYLYIRYHGLVRQVKLITKFLIGPNENVKTKDNSNICSIALHEGIGNTMPFRTVCQRRSDPFYIVSYYMKRVTTSWTYSSLHFTYQEF